MNHKQMKRSLRRSIEDRPSINFDALADMPVEKMTRHDHFTVQKQTQTKRVKKKWKPVTAIASLITLLVLLTPVLFAPQKPVYTATLDINPSIELALNEEMELIEVTPLNEDAELILQRSQLDLNDLDATLDHLIDTLIEEGYLSEDTNVLLLSVKGNDEIIAQKIADTLDAELVNSLKSRGIEPVIFSQVYQEDEQARQVAQSYGISEGKMRLIQQILSQNGQYNNEDLVGLTMRELYTFTQQNGMDVSDYVYDHQSNQGEPNGPDNDNQNEEPNGPAGNHQDERDTDETQVNKDNSDATVDENKSDPDNETATPGGPGENGN